MAEPSGRESALRPVSRPRLYKQLVERLLEILEAREAIEVEIASLAAQRRTEEDMDAIDAALDKMAAEVAAGEHGYDGDMTFHAAVTSAARNPILTGLMDLLAESIQETRRESLSQPGLPLLPLASHRSIAKAIRRGDPASAARASRRHITLVADVALLTVESEHGANTEPETGGGTDLPLANSLPDQLTSGVVVA